MEEKQKVKSFRIFPLISINLGPYIVIQGTKYDSQTSLSPLNHNTVSRNLIFVTYISIRIFSVDLSAVINVMAQAN
jgi:hypothetical protein